MTSLLAERPGRHFVFAFVWEDWASPDRAARAARGAQFLVRIATRRIAYVAGEALLGIGAVTCGKRLRGRHEEKRYRALGPPGMFYDFPNGVHHAYLRSRRCGVTWWVVTGTNQRLESAT